MADDSQSSQFDPNEHNVDEVHNHFENSDTEEVERVKALESEGQNRVTVMNWEATETEEDVEEEEEKPQPKVKRSRDSDYDPHKDPDVPSSAIANVIATELRANGSSTTLDAVRGSK